MTCSSAKQKKNARLGFDYPHVSTVNARLSSRSFPDWHEAYHLGGLVAMRKQLGYPSLAELTLSKAAG
jgi:hypothetical protein